MWRYEDTSRHFRWEWCSTRKDADNDNEAGEAVTGKLKLLR